MNKIDDSFYLPKNQPTRTPGTELGKEEFLKILMVQLQNQDPLNPMEDKEFISQMATFSSLEQTMNMAKSIDALVQSQLISPIVQYSHMIGQTVSYYTYDEETGQIKGTDTSEVLSVIQKDGWAIFKLANGEEIYADSIIEAGTGKNNTGEGS
ncbi:MAG TPA: flagellar hook assembly protein FlgD [Bacillota bacterium]|nr:flagellar hook assembly protein FlgD [Bacillota bacterium]